VIETAGAATAPPDALLPSSSGRPRSHDRGRSLFRGAGAVLSPPRTLPMTPRRTLAGRLAGPRPHPSGSV